MEREGKGSTPIFHVLIGICFSTTSLSLTPFLLQFCAYHAFILRMLLACNTLHISLAMPQRWAARAENGWIVSRGGKQFTMGCRGRGRGENALRELKYRSTLDRQNGWPWRIYVEVFLLCNSALSNHYSLCRNCTLKKMSAVKPEDQNLKNRKKI